MKLYLTNLETISDAAPLDLNRSFSVVTIPDGDRDRLFVAVDEMFRVVNDQFIIGDDGVVAVTYDDAGLMTVNDIVNDPGSDMASLQVFEVDGNTYIAATGRSSSTAIHMFSVGSEGTLTLVDDVPESLLGAQQQTSAKAKIDGTDILLTASASNGGALHAFTVDQDGALDLVDTVPDDGETFLDGTLAVATAVIGDQTFVVAGGGAAQGVSTFSLEGNGALENLFNLSHSAAARLEVTRYLETAEVGGTTYVFAQFNDSFIDRVEPGITVLALGNDGALTPTDEFFETGGGWGALTVFTRYGKTFLASGEFIFLVNDGGSLTELDYTIDGMSARFGVGQQSQQSEVLYTVSSGSLTALDFVPLIDPSPVSKAVAENQTDAVTVTPGYEGVNFSIVGGADAAVFSVKPMTGRVSFTEAPDFDEPGDADGDNVYEVDVLADDGLFSETKTLTIEVANLPGLAVLGTPNADGLQGSGEEDVVRGRRGDDTLEGLAGNDVLNGGANRDILIGGAGRDGFLFSNKIKKKHADMIVDFQPGEDQILLEWGRFDRLDGLGTLDPDALGSGKRAKSEDEHILYQKKTGWLRYTEEAGVKGTKFAKIDEKLDLSESDFLVV